MIACTKSAVFLVSCVVEQGIASGQCRVMLSSLVGLSDPLVCLVVKASASRAEDPESNHTSDLNIGTPVATLRGA